MFEAYKIFHGFDEFTHTSKIQGILKSTVHLYKPHISQIPVEKNQFSDHSSRPSNGSNNVQVKRRKSPWEKGP